jgi:hypothetical protein
MTLRFPTSPHRALRARPLSRPTNGAASNTTSARMVAFRLGSTAPPFQGSRSGLASPTPTADSGRGARTSPRLRVSTSAGSRTVAMRTPSGTTIFPSALRVLGARRAASISRPWALSSQPCPLRRHEGECIYVENMFIQNHALWRDFLSQLLRSSEVSVWKRYGSYIEVYLDHIPALLSTAPSATP